MSNNIDRPKLGGAFSGAPTRSEGLGDLLKPRPQSTGQPVPVPTERPAEVRQTPPKSQSKRSAPAANAGRVQNVVAYLEQEVYEAVKIARRTGVEAGQPDKSYDQVLVEALAVVTADDLSHHYTPEPASDSGSLIPTRVRRPRGTGGVQLNFRLDGSQRDKLDNLAIEVGAPSRSSLVDTALRLALLGKQTRGR